MESPLQHLEFISQASTNTNSFQSHPKIKPLITRYYHKKCLNEHSLKKLSILHDKTLKRVECPSRKATDLSAKDIRRSTQIIRKQDSLSSLDCRFICHIMSQSLYLTSKLKNLSCLSLPNLSISRGKERVFLKCLVNLKNLEHFSVRSAFHNFENSAFLFKVLRSLSRLKKLKSLSLNFASLGQFCENEEQILMSSIGKLTQLRALKLSFQGSIQYDEQNIMNKLTPILPKLTKLTEIDINFKGDTIIIQESALMKLFQSFKAIKILSNISLNLSECSVFHKQDEEILKNCLLSLDSSLIRKLSLGFNTNLPAQNLVKIVQTLQRFTSLNVLHLNLGRFRTLNDKDMNQLSEALGSFISLSSLRLVIPPGVEAKSILGNVASALKTLLDLRHFKLEIGGKIQASSCQLQEFFSSLKGLKLLKFLEIDSRFVQDDFVEGLGETLQELTPLNALTFNSYWNEEMTAVGIQHLCCGIGKRQGLLSLNLNLAECKINEQAMESIAGIVRSIDSLWSVNLSLYRLPVSWRKDDDVSGLFGALKEMKNVKEVALVIVQSEVNDRLVNELGREKNVKYSPQYTWMKR